VAAKNLPKIHQVKVEVHPPDMHPTVASYALRLQKLVIKKHQISLQGDGIALLIKSIYMS
jgi:hypothetical protein